MSISKTILVGTLGKDPTIGQTQGGKDYANFSLATSKEGVEMPTTKIMANVIDIIKGKEREGGISEHSQAKGNGFQPQSDDIDDEIMF